MWLPEGIIDLSLNFNLHCSALQSKVNARRAQNSRQFPSHNALQIGLTLYIVQHISKKRTKHNFTNSQCHVIDLNAIVSFNHALICHQKHANHPFDVLHPLSKKELINNNNNNNDFITAFPTYRRLFICNNKLATLSTLKKKNKNIYIYIYITSIYN